MKTALNTLFFFFIFPVVSLGQTSKINPTQSGYTTITGSIINYNKNYDQFRSIEIQVTDWTTSLRRQYFTEADSLGNFSISFFIFNNQDVLFTFNNKWHAIFVNPNDTLNITIDAFNFPDGNKYEGRTAKICRDYLIYYTKNYKSYLEFANKNNHQQTVLSYERYKQWRDSVYYSDLKAADNFIRDYELNDFLSRWIKNDAYLMAMRDKISYCLQQPRFQNTDISLINQLKAQDSTLRYNSNYAGIVNSGAILTSMYASKLYSRDNPIILSKPTQNSAENNVPPRPSEEEIKTKTEQQNIKIFKYFIDATDSIKNDLLRQSIITARYLSILENQNIDVGLDSILNRITDYRIKASLLLESNGYHFRKGNFNSLDIKNPGNTLLDSLKNSYKGYVLYIDFWGTWCAPCYSQMKIMKRFEKEYLNKKIVFIYLCCKCQKDKWVNESKDSKGQHIYLTSDQYAYLSKKFNIISLPRYVIIDKKGNVITENGPMPSETSFENKLKSYLKD
jgi:thiol-disulfide isomerase/thioredoxin